MLQKAIQTVKTTLGFQTEQKAIALSDPDIAEIFNILPTASGVVINPTTAIRVPAVLQALRLISQACGSLPFKTYTDTREVAKQHPSYKLVHGFANEYTSAGAFREALTSDALIHGAGYGYVQRNADGVPVLLQQLDPTSVQRKLYTTGEPHYVVTVNNRQHPVHFRDMIYIPNFAGLSLVNTGREAIAVAAITEKRAAEQFSGAAAIAVSLKPLVRVGDTPAGATALANAIASLRRMRQNGDAFISNEYEMENHTLTSTDSQFIENRRFQIGEVARVFNIPPTMLFDLERGTWSNTEEMRRTFEDMCLRPWLDTWTAAYSICLLGEDQSGLYIEAVIDDLMRANVTARTEAFGKLIAMRAMTPNEVRARMNLPPLPGGDSLENPYTTNTPAALPAPAEQENTDNAE